MAFLSGFGEITFAISLLSNFHNLYVTVSRGKSPPSFPILSPLFLFPAHSTLASTSAPGGLSSVADTESRLALLSEETYLNTPTKLTGHGYLYLIAF